MLWYVDVLVLSKIMLFIDPKVSLSMPFEVTADVFGKEALIDEINKLPWYKVAKIFLSLSLFSLS